MSQTVTIRFRRLRQIAGRQEALFRASAGAAGFDLFSAADSPVEVLPGKLAELPTGVAVKIPEGYAGFVFGRSGLGIRHGIMPSNAVGVIDSDYTGEIIVGLCNVSDRPYTIFPGDRIAQLVVLPTPNAEFVEAEALEQTARGERGFGSTGR